MEHLVFTLDKEQRNSGEMKEKLMHFECAYSHSKAYLAEIILPLIPKSMLIQSSAAAGSY